MEQDTGILIIQVMQLPIVALIIAFTFRSPRQSVIRRRWGLGQIGVAFRGTPLRFIAIGLFYNLLYLLVKLGAHKAVSVFNPEAEETRMLLLATDLFTTFFFLIETVGWLTRIGRIRGRSLGLPKWSLWIFNQRHALALAIFLFYIGMFLRNADRFHYDFFVVDFCAYLIVGIFLRHKMRSGTPGANIYSNNYIFYGFCLWAVLQLMVLFNPILHLQDDTIELIGFGGSLLGKAAILFGLYDFSVKTTIYTARRLKEKNDELQKRVDDGLQLQECINEVSNSIDIPELADYVVRHMTRGGIFSYHYAIFYGLDHLGKTLIPYTPWSVDSGIDKIDKWNTGPIDLRSSHLCARVFQTRSVAYVQGGRIDGVKIDWSAPDCPLDKNVFDDHNQIRLERFFIPILDRGDITDRRPVKDVLDRMKVIAVLEVGNYRDAFFDSAGKKKIYNSIDLRIYLDNCVQVFNRLIEKWIEDEVEKRLEIANRHSGDDHLKYLTEVLRLLCAYIKADHGLALLLSVDEVVENPCFLHLTGNVSEGVIQDLKRSAIRCYAGRPAGPSGRMQAEDELIWKLTDSLRIASTYRAEEIPVHTHLAAKIFLFSTQPDFFNGMIKNIVSMMAGAVAGIFQQKKFHKVLMEAVVPDNTITDPEMNIQPIIHLLKDYFSTSYVSIWIRDNPVGPTGKYVQKYGSPELRKACENFHKKTVTQDEIDFAKDCRILHFANDTTAGYWGFDDTHQSHCLLQKHLKTHTHEFGFINLYFNQEYGELSNEDASFLNLMAAKVVMTLQIHNIVSAFRDITDSLIRNDLNRTLTTITQKAMALLLADPVILFRSRNGEDVFFRDTTYSKIEGFRDPVIEKLFTSTDDRHVELAERVLAHKSEFFGNYKEYHDYVARVPKKYERVNFNQSFWEREGIRAFAAVRLVNKYGNKERPVGVMFINFRREIVFTKELIQIIETFAALASGGIMNGLSAERSRQYLLGTLKRARPLMGDRLIRGALHDAKKVYTAINGKFFSFLERIEQESRSSRIRGELMSELRSMELPIKELHELFEKLSLLYRDDDSLIIATYDLDRIIYEQLENLSLELTDKNIEPILTLQKPPIKLDCDKTLIGSALFNLMHNAWYALFYGGTLEIRTYETKDGKVVIEIIDNGSPVSETVRKNMFDAYVTDKPEGSGWGLPMSKYIAEKHSGSLTFTITRSGRKVFTLILPKTIKTL